MDGLRIGVILLLLSFVSHLLIWRVSLPSRQTVALLVIFMFVPVFTMLLFAFAGKLPHLSVAEVTRIALFYVSFSLVYIVCYSAIENESPTLAIISYIAHARDVGCTSADLLERFGRGTVIVERFASMERAGWVTRTGDSVHLSPEGRFYGRLFDFAARVFGIAKGG